MARPRGYILNPEAIDDWLEARGLTRTAFCEAVGMGPSTLSGMTRLGKEKGASLPLALRMAAVLRVQPGSIFPRLIGRVAVDEDGRATVTEDGKVTIVEAGRIVEQGEAA